MSRLLSLVGGPVYAWLLGVAMFAVGERYAAGTAAYIPVVLFSLVLIVLGVGVRVMEARTSKNAARTKALRSTAAWMLLGVVAVLIYLSTTDAVLGMFGLDEEAQATWYVLGYSLSGICFLMGALPAFTIDRALAVHPIQLPINAQAGAQQAGIVTALALALFAPVNYLASENNVDLDYAYFRTTRAGDSTKALVRTLPDPVEVVLFYPRGNEVLRELETYFTDVAEASDGALTVRVVDQALAPELSEKLRVNDNGYVVFTRGEASEKWKVGTEIDRAKRNLKKLDLESQKRLLKLAKGERTVYLMAGHGEASTREKENPARKLSQFKKKLQEQGLQVKEFGAADGSLDAIPDDAAFLVVAAPTKPLTVEEDAAISVFLDGGGSLLVLAAPGTDPLAGLLAPLGLKVTEDMLGHETKFLPQSRTVADRLLLVTNRYGAHDSIRELQRNSQRYIVVVPSVAGLEKIEGGRGKQTATLRTFPDTWLESRPMDFKRGAEEVSRVWDIGMAVEGEGEDGFRVLVFGDENLFSDAALKSFEGNERLVEDAARWLMGDEELAGETESEEDVKVTHTRDEDIVWFLASAFGIPLLFVFVGLIRIRMRRK